MTPLPPRGTEADLCAAEARADRQRRPRAERAPYRGAHEDRSGLVEAALRGMRRPRGTQAQSTKEDAQ